MDLYSSIDRFVSAMGEKYNYAVHGKLVNEIGSLPVNEWGLKLSLSIRQRKRKKPHVLFSFAEEGEGEGFEIPCTREWAEQLERLAQEMKKHLDSETSATH